VKLIITFQNFALYFEFGILDITRVVRISVMFKPAQLEVESWKGDWGLPSVDYKCLEVLVYN